MDTVVVFTAKNFDQTIQQGGSGNWKLNADRVKRCDYVILTANSQHRESSHSKKKHRHAFLIGKISGVSPEAYDDLGNREDDRWIIEFSEYADIDIPGLWGGFQNPVKYGLLADYEIDPYSLDWRPFPTDRIVDRALINVPPLTIEQAKLGMAKKLGITPDCIEIIIRA